MIDKKRLISAFGWGVLATVVMSIPMVVSTVAGVSPMPKPIPAALVEHVFGSGLPKPAHMLLAAASHLAYGGAWAMILAVFTRRVTFWKGVGLGAFLWLLMGVAVLPLLGWGLFGVGETPKIAVATLVLHLIYGGTLGGLMSWRERKATTPQST